MSRSGDGEPRSPRSAMAQTYEATTYLNVDLELTSQHDLAPLADALRPHVYTLHVGRRGRWYWASFELHRPPRTPDAAIRRLVEVLRRLTPRQRAHWKRATRRDFNVGIQAAPGPYSREFPIEAETVAIVGAVGGRIVVTVYGSSPSAE